jgi:hypothetical protein
MILIVTNHPYLRAGCHNSYVHKLYCWLNSMENNETCLGLAKKIVTPGSSLVYFIFIKVVSLK